MFDYEAKPDDVWIYLPALRKTRRIVSSQKAQSFMGSEFSYGDLNIPALDDFDYKLDKEETYKGEACWVIDLTPKSKDVADSDGYSKKTYWVSKDKFAVVHGLYYDKDGKLLKELVAENIKLLDPKNKRYRPMHMEMINKQNGRKSVFESTKIAFAPEHQGRILHDLISGEVAVRPRGRACSSPSAVRRHRRPRGRGGRLPRLPDGSPAQGHFQIPRLRRRVLPNRVRLLGSDRAGRAVPGLLQSETHSEPRAEGPLTARQWPIWSQRPPVSMPVSS